MQNMMYDSECLRGKPNTSNRNRKKSKLTSGAGGDHFHCQRWIGQRRRHYCTVWSCTQAFAEIHRHWCSHQIRRFSHTANFQWAPAKFYFHTKFGPKIPPGIWHPSPHSWRENVQGNSLRALNQSCMKPECCWEKQCIKSISIPSMHRQNWIHIQRKHNEYI